MYDSQDIRRMAALLLDLWDRFKLVILAPVYLVGIAVLGYRAFFLFGPFIIAAAVAYTFDKEREAQGKDDFRGDWLFFRYGEEVDRVFFGLPVNASWSAEEIARFATHLREKLAERVQQQLSVKGVEARGDLVIRDQSTSETKAFFRLTLRSRFGSTMTQFIHYAEFGQTLTAHHFLYRRGTQSEWDVVKFALAAPWEIWFWGIPWLVNRFSIIASLSRFRASSFDGIDMNTMYNVAVQVLRDELEKILAEAGLLTEEVKQILQYNIKTTNNIKIRNSPHVTLDNVRQSSFIGAHGKAAMG